MMVLFHNTECGNKGNQLNSWFIIIIIIIIIKYFSLSQTA